MVILLTKHKMEAPEYSSKNSKVEQLSPTCAELLMDLPQGPRALVWGSNKVSWSFLLIRFVGGRVEETNQENYRFFMAPYRKYRQARRLRFTTESFSVDNWNIYIFCSLCSQDSCRLLSVCYHTTKQCILWGIQCHLFIDYNFTSLDYKNHTNDSTSVLF